MDSVSLAKKNNLSFNSLAPMKHLLVLLVNDNQMISLEEIPHLPFLQVHAHISLVKYTRSCVRLIITEHTACRH